MIARFMFFYKPGVTVVEQSSAPGMALYPTCQTSIHNIEFCHGCFAILIVYQSMFSSFISYATVLVRPDDMVRIEVRCAFGLARVFYSSIRRVGDLGALE